MQRKVLQHAEQSIRIICRDVGVMDSIEQAEEIIHEKTLHRTCMRRTTFAAHLIYKRMVQNLSL